ncbi:sigma-70 region 4 domain-containing protein (plasmid) [Avibacterium paragallinarum]|uniref:sigma-70 region 4 domain-containing protein n=1 Tax=Avibacterium paragallinarum TaxID=728 RepID=UPI0021E28CD3|nr:sigma-70 region 4 domain-containing protein [Avibacterium paragallinarum]UXN35799.1 sigma-70 region 4 domain-containing protein [Avibacterium paragallinarum]
MNFPNQYLKANVKEWAKKKGLSEVTIRRDFKELGLSKTREQYEKDAQIRREMAYKLRQQGLKYREIAETLGVSVNNAQQLVRRFQQQ